jgi:predicted RNase H-like HicB family nuclease
MRMGADPVQTSLQCVIQSLLHPKIEIEHEEDGRRIAEIPQLPGVLAYGATPDEASARVEILALRVLAEQLEHGEAKPWRSASRWQRHDCLAVGEGAQSPLRAHTHPPS